MIDLDRALALEREIRAKHLRCIHHQRDKDDPRYYFCQACGVDWPCDAIRAADFIRDALTEVEKATRGTRLQAEHTLEVAAQRDAALTERDALRAKLDALAVQKEPE